MTHEKEICRWAKSPDETKVWEKREGGDWTLKSVVSWNQNNIYIVDDKHAEIRKQWIDEGKPTVQIKAQDGEWVDLNGTPEWHDCSEYRIKPKAWYEEIPDAGLLCWVLDDKSEPYQVDIITRYLPGEIKKFRGVTKFWREAEPMKEYAIERRTYRKDMK